MQFQADILGIPVERSAVKETTALGAGYLAGIGAGFWSGPDDISTLWRARQPLPTQDERRPKSLSLRRLAQGRRTRLSLGTGMRLTKFPGTSHPFRHLTV